MGMTSTREQEFRLASLTDEPTAHEMHEYLLIIMRGVNGQAFRQVGNRIVRGPFKGMVIPEVTPWYDGNASTKLLGAYEFELHDVIERAIARAPTAVVNIGCAEGYYAIGLGMRLPDAEVIAVDVDQSSINMCREYARLNGVSVAALRGFGSALDLNAAVGGTKGLFVVDCEGDELALLDKTECPALLSSDIIVECHDFLNDTISSTLAHRFCDTHDVELVRPRLPRFDDYPFLSSSPTVMSLLAVTEKRPMPTCWLACWAKHKGA